ncbi:hypothetical protein ACC771_24065, partial [Rhizobium ruizarguesonis]
MVLPSEGRHLGLELLQVGDVGRYDLSQLVWSHHLDQIPYRLKRRLGLAGNALEKEEKVRGGLRLW